MPKKKKNQTLEVENNFALRPQAEVGQLRETNVNQTGTRHPICNPPRHLGFFGNANSEVQLCSLMPLQVVLHTISACRYMIFE